MSLKAGQIGQIQGPFYINQDVASEISNSGQDVLLGITIGEKDYMQAPFYFVLNGRTIYMGSTCMYELSNPIALTSLVFPLGAPASLIIDYVGLGD